jgi:hypothetical protein
MRIRSWFSQVDEGILCAVHCAEQFVELELQSRRVAVLA